MKVFNTIIATILSGIIILSLAAAASAVIKNEVQDTKINTLHEDILEIKADVKELLHSGKCGD